MTNKATLLLNADGSPVSVIPLSAISWKDAIGYMVAETATVLEWHDNWVVHSAYWETKVPAVIILNKFSKKKVGVRYSKQNVFLRDGYICQYCGDDVSRSSATLDHVLPTSLGGKSTFENSVCACGTCNANKGNNHKIVPKVKAIKPTYYQLVAQRKKMPFELHHPSWAMYLGLDQT